MIIGIDHVQITIPKGAEEQGRAFYCGLLGLPEIEKPASLKGRGGFWLQVGDRAVHVGTEDGFDRYSTKSHIAYRVTDIDHWRVVLAGAGIHIEESIPIPGHTRFECRDPFGNRVEITQLLS
ncbi:MAG: VOC family protein [Anaerolineae bacterium]|nr:VOC family protein [Anaerolineae bacterium]MBN8618714.1 VOC family protein [Anaerolineae bacterium]